MLNGWHGKPAKTKSSSENILTGNKIGLNEGHKFEGIYLENSSKIPSLCELGALSKTIFNLPLITCN